MFCVRQRGSGMTMNIPQETTKHGQRVSAGLSFLFTPGERPGAAILRSALEVCQAAACVTREEVEGGAVEVVANGLTFDIDGLAPAQTSGVDVSVGTFGFDEPEDAAGLEAVRFYPGHHLSGGVALAPVIRTQLALAAELAISLPVRAIHWHPADTLVEPRTFSRTVLAWLAGGAFPARSLTALSQLNDGSVVSRGLAHFVGQEMSLRSPVGKKGRRTLDLAAKVIDLVVRAGPLQALTRWTIAGEVLCAEPARQGREILVWPVEESAVAPIH